MAYGSRRDHQRRRHPVHRLLPRPRRHASAPPAPTPPAAPPNAPPTARKQRSWPATWHDAQPRRDHVPDLRRTRLAALQAHRGHHPGRLRVEPEQTLLPVLRTTTDAPRSPPPWSRTGSPRPPPDGLSPRSIRKYHTMLHSIFKRAVRDQLIVTNPCEHTELPKVITKKTRTLTPEEYDALIAAIPARHRLMVETAIETGMRWGELIALQTPPHRLPHAARSPSRRPSSRSPRSTPPPANATSHKPYPKDNEPRTFGVRQDWLDAVAAHIEHPRHRPRRSAVHHHRRDPAVPQHLPHPRLAPRRHRQRDRLPRPHARPPPRPRLLAPRRRLRPQVRHGTHGPRPNPNHPEIPPHAPRSRPEEPRRPRPDHTTRQPHVTGDHQKTTSPLRGLPRNAVHAVPAMWRTTSIPRRPTQHPTKRGRRRCWRLIGHG